MRAPLTSAAPAKATGAVAVEVWRCAVGRLSWRVLGITLALTVALNAYVALQERYFGAFYAIAANSNVLIGLAVMFATLIADELVARGARRLPVYASAVLIGSAVGLLAQWPVHRWVAWLSSPVVPVIPEELGFAAHATAFLEYLIWGSIIVFVYANRRSALRAADRMSAAQVRRAEIQRRSIESRLQALQARVEPQFLFDSLERVRDLYESDPVQGDQVMAALIAYLRAALPHLRETASTLQRELELANAYLSVMRAQLGERLVCSVDACDVPSDVRMPAMIVLPLINHALARPALSARRDVIRVSARRAMDKLRLEIAHSGQSFSSVSGNRAVRDIEQRLRGLYGETWALALEPTEDRGTRAVVEIPYESDGGHR